MKSSSHFIQMNCAKIVSVLFQLMFDLTMHMSGFIHSDAFSHAMWGGSPMLAPAENDVKSGAMHRARLSGCEMSIAYAVLLTPQMLTPQPTRTHRGHIERGKAQSCATTHQFTVSKCRNPHIELHTGHTHLFAVNL
jgi:hypothetical protein